MRLYAHPRKQRAYLWTRQHPVENPVSVTFRIAASICTFTVHPSSAAFDIEATSADIQHRRASTEFERGFCSRGTVLRLRYSRGDLLFELKRTGSFALVAWLHSSFTSGRRRVYCAIEKALLLWTCEKGFPRSFLASTDGETVVE